MQYFMHIYAADALFDLKIRQCVVTKCALFCAICHNNTLLDGFVI